MHSTTFKKVQIYQLIKSVIARRIKNLTSETKADIKTQEQIQN